MKKFFRQGFLLMTALTGLLAFPARGGVFSDRMDQVHPGMGAHSVVTILGQPTGFTKGSDGSVRLNYVTEDGVWAVTIYQGRVLRIDRP